MCGHFLYLTGLAFNKAYIIGQRLEYKSSFEYQISREKEPEALNYSWDVWCRTPILQEIRTLQIMFPTCPVGLLDFFLGTD